MWNKWHSELKEKKRLQNRAQGPTRSSKWEWQIPVKLQRRAGEDWSGDGDRGTCPTGEWQWKEWTRHNTTLGKEKRVPKLLHYQNRLTEWFIWQVALLHMHSKRRILRRKKRKPGCGERKGSPAPGTHARCSRKALALKDYLHGVSKAGWLLAAQREKSSYGVNAHKPYCFLRCSHALRNHDSEIQCN